MKVCYVANFSNWSFESKIKVKWLIQLACIPLSVIWRGQAPFIQSLDNVIHWINLYWVDGTVVFFFYHLREQFIHWIAIFVLYTTGPQRIANPQTGMPTHCRLLFISPLCPHPSTSSGFTNNLAVSIYTPGCREALYKQSVLPKSTTPIPRPLNSV